MPDGKDTIDNSLYENGHSEMPYNHAMAEGTRYSTLLTYGAGRSAEAISFDGSTVHTVVADRSSNATPDVNHNDERMSLLLRSALRLRTRSALEGRPRCPLPFSGYSSTRLPVMSRVPLFYVFMSTVGLFMAHYAHALRYSSLHQDRLPESLASK